jgi:hypothetical protein
MHFPVFAKNIRRPWMKLKEFFCQFLNPWALRVSGMGGYTSKCEKSQNHCTLMYSLIDVNTALEATCCTQKLSFESCAEFNPWSSQNYIIDYFLRKKNLIILIIE